MSICLLGGVAKGFNLQVPKGDAIRPTAVRLKRKFFDSQQDWSNRIFIDLCAGTGSMGLEAWSRGASKVVLVESGRRVYPLLSKNVERLYASWPEAGERPIEVVNISADKFLSGAHEWLNCDTTIFLDPPYTQHNLYKKIVLEQMPSLASSIDEFWLESDEQKGLSRQFWIDSGLTEEKCFSQGASYLGRYTF